MFLVQLDLWTIALVRMEKVEKVYFFKKTLVKHCETFYIITRGHHDCQSKLIFAILSSSQKVTELPKIPYLIYIFTFYPFLPPFLPLFNFYNRYNNF